MREGALQTWIFECGKWGEIRRAPGEPPRSASVCALSAGGGAAPRRRSAGGSAGELSAFSGSPSPSRTGLRVRSANCSLLSKTKTLTSGGGWGGGAIGRDSIFTDGFMLDFAVVQVSALLFLEQMLEAFELVNVERLQPDEFLSREERHLLGRVHASVSAGGGGETRRHRQPEIGILVKSKTPRPTSSSRATASR